MRPTPGPALDVLVKATNEKAGPLGADSSRIWYNMCY